jgi:hypothetical protein
VEAIRYWWGAAQGVVHRWRKCLDVSRTNNHGTHRLVQASAQAGSDAVKTRGFTDAERQARREQAMRLDLGRPLQPGYHGPRWTAAQRKLLGKLPDAEVAAQIGRTVGAVRQKRNVAGLPRARDGRRRYGAGPGRTQEQRTESAMTKCKPSGLTFGGLPLDRRPAGGFTPACTRRCNRPNNRLSK